MAATRFSQLADDAKTRIREITLDDLQARRKPGEAPCVIIDVREADEWAQGHMPGAIHISKGVLERDIEKKVPDPQAEIVLYCGGGSRSALAADNLQKMGYQRVWSLAGGFGGWKKACLPIEVS